MSTGFLSVNANQIGLIAAALSIVAFSLSYALLRQQTRPIRTAALALLALLSIPSVLFAVYYLHVLPEWAWFYTLRSWRCSEMLALILGCAGGAVATLLPRCLLALPLFAVISVAIIPYMKPFLGPLPDDVFTERWQGDACLQSTSSTCGPASVSTILKRLGEAPSEFSAARASFSYVGGTEAWYLARYVRSKGFVARFDFRETFVPSAGLPAVVGVRLGSVGHFIAVLAMNGDRITFADPLRGEENLPLSEFLHRYEFTGFHMVITKT